MGRLENKLESIRLLKGVLILTNRMEIDLATVNSLQYRALKAGVSIDTNVFLGLSLASAEVLTNNIILKYGVDLAKVNSTFFKTFDDTRNTPDTLRLIYQLIHYASTYGGFEELQNSGEMFEPEVINADNWDSTISFTKSLISIKAFTLDEMVSKVSSLAFSGIALDEADVDFLFDFIVAHFSSFDDGFIDKVKNRELLARLAVALNVVPKNFDDLIRVIMYVVTGSAMVINNKKMKAVFSAAPIENKKRGALLFSRYISLYGEVEASKYATRYRDFLMLLKNDSIKTSVNKVLKLSKKNYIPRKVDPLSTITSPKVSVSEVIEILENSMNAGTLTIYRLVRLINAVRKTKAAGLNPFVDVIKIRNGKIHVREEQQLTKLQLTLLRDKEKALKSFISKLIGDKVAGKVFLFNNQFVPVAPTSGKSFAGFLPEYSYFNVGSEAAVVGIAWEKQGDIDLHGTTQAGNFGWHTSWSNDEVTYTGDMTSLNKFGFASEFYESKLDENEILNISASPFRYKGDYQVIIAKSPLTTNSTKDSTAIVDNVQDIIYTDTRHFDDNVSQPLFSLVKIDGVYRAVVTSGNGLGQNVINHDKVRETLEYISRTIKSRLTMEDLLESAGAKVLRTEDPENVIQFNDNKTPLEIVMMTPEAITQELFTSIFTEVE